MMSCPPVVPNHPDDSDLFKPDNLKSIIAEFISKLKSKYEDTATRQNLILYFIYYYPCEKCPQKKGNVKKGRGGFGDNVLSFCNLSL